MKRVVIVEDHSLTRTGLRTTLENEFSIAGEAADGVAGLKAIQAEKPDVAVIDIGLPGMDGIELTHRVRHEVPATHVLILTMIDEEEEVLAALSAGADAYCLKTSDPERLIDAVRNVADGGAYFDPQIAHLVLARIVSGEPAKAPESPLSERETQILRLIADGIGNADIALRLNIGLGTVKGHIRDILEKLAAADRTQAAVTALRRGYI
ncbi:MAG: response regulator transcription factor [Candidatus Eremiobacteraeota bacterium]|nr:response regulator transcription factor [Candidatus Eremiobacteraeota bacterium]